MDPELSTFRDTIRRVTPWWLHGFIGYRILYSIAIVLDALGDAANAAVRARFPTSTDASALALLGRERRIQRGRLETAVTFAARLLGWLDAHRQRGGPYGLLVQLAAFWAQPALFAIQLIYWTGRRFSQDTAGVITRDDLPTWTGDGGTDWARWWLVFSWPTALGTDGLWSDPGTWDDGGIWDVAIGDLDAETASDCRLVPREWNAAHAQGRVILLAPGAELWDIPTGTWGDPGTWGDGSGYVSLDPEQS